MLNIEPEFHLPSCYNVQPPPANTKIGNFSDETLFFIFYSQPRDAMQEMAAHELCVFYYSLALSRSACARARRRLTRGGLCASRYKHNWRYHKELRLWLTKEAGTEPVQKTATFERGSYMCVPSLSQSARLGARTKLTLRPLSLARAQLLRPGPVGARAERVRPVL